MNENTIDIPEIYKMLVPLVHAIHSVKSERRIEATISNFSVLLVKDEYDTSISVQVNDLQEAIVIGIEPIREKLSNQMLYNEYRNRYRLILNNHAENAGMILKYLDSDLKEDSFTYMLGITEEKLFQVSTLRAMPTPEQIDEVQGIMDLFNFLEGYRMRLAFTSIEEFKDKQFVDDLIGTVWRMTSV